MVDLNALTLAEQNFRNQFFRADGALQRLRSFVIMNTHIPRSGNCILWGPGGYGKTEMSHQFLKDATGQEPFVVNLNQATTAAEMYGGVDINKFANGGGIEYLLDKSFMEHEWVIFEEGLEPRPRVLSALKHIITSGVFAAAGVGSSLPIKTKGILIVTNIDTAGFQDSLDTAAFLERFPLQYCVNWNHLNAHERYSASMQVIEKFDTHGAIPLSFRETLASDMANKKKSPRMISRAVQALVSTAAMHKRMVDKQIFLEVGELFGYASDDMSQKIENDRHEHEVKEARKAYEEMFKNIDTSIQHYNNLREYLNDPAYIIKLGRQLNATMELIDALSESVVDMRVNTRFGSHGDELASWVNGKLGEFNDKLDDIKHASFNGMLHALIKLTEKKEDAETNV